MEVTISYPPAAYPFMPYLAPYLLKGYVERESEHRVTAHDLNAEYHLQLWSPRFGHEAAAELDAAGDRRGALIAELVAERASGSWAALREPATYADAAAVRTHALVLKEATRVAAALDRLRGASARLPGERGRWGAVLDALERSVAGRQLAAAVDAGLYAGADVVGLCLAYVNQLAPGLLLARLLRRRDPGLVIVAGGGAITHFLPEVRTDLSLWADIDFCIPYEGEWSLVELLDALAAGREPPRVNVARRDGAAIAYRRDLSARPHVSAAPDFSDLRHLQPTPVPVYPLLTSKGCYWGKCAFCTHHEGYGQGYQRFSDDLVERTVRDLVRVGARAFYPVDEAVPPRTLTRLAELLVAARDEDAGGEPIRWLAEVRLERQLDRVPSVRLLAESGCRLLVNGLESGDQRVLDSMLKGVDLGRAASYAREARAAGIRTGWMFFVGFPGETEEEAEATFRFIERHAGVLDHASVGAFVLERGSPVWDAPAAFGVEAIEDPERPYPLGFSYRTAAGERVDALDPERRRRALVARHPGLARLFGEAGDRALAAFLAPPGEPAPAARAPGPELTWRSRLLGGTARLDLERRRVVVTRDGG